MSGFRFHTIRSRLLIGFVLMALLSAVGISAGSVIVGFINSRQQTIDRLGSVTALKAVGLVAWKKSLLDELFVVSNEQYAAERVSVVLDLANANKYYNFYLEAMRRRLHRFLEQSENLQEVFLLDLAGDVVLSTLAETEHGNCSGETFFQQGSLAPYIQLPFSYGGQVATDHDQPGIRALTGGCPYVRQDETVVIAARPVIDRTGQPVGVIASRGSARAMTEILADRTGLGKTGKTYLADAGGAILLADTEPSSKDPDVFGESPQRVQSWIPDAADGGEAGGTGIYEDWRGTRVIGVSRRLPEFEVTLWAEQDLSESISGIYTNLKVDGMVVLLAVVLASGASFFITRSITGPLVDLVDTATVIAAGDLGRMASVKRDDEVGVLARAFNTMTSQLRDLVDNLERRVQERTEDLQVANEALQRRAVQLETSAQVSQEITSILDIDQLLAQVVQLIRDAFGYYHVHILLIDRERGRLNVRASTLELSLFPGFLEIGGGSLNGQVAETGKAALVNDVTKEPSFLAVHHLPDTRSELVIPLRVAEQLIGTLDVHSSEMDAFRQEDVLVIQSLGDQIAIAIENARLYERSRELAVLEERNRLARELHDSVIQSLYSLTLLSEGWRFSINDAETAKMDEYLVRVCDISHQGLREMRLLVHELRPPALQQEGLLAALHQRLGAVESRSGIETRLLAEDLYDLPTYLEEGLYRIAQEALNNALKHADATQVAVQIRADGNSIILEISDNGRGFQPESTSSTGGIGLNSMRERAAQMGGALSILSTPGQGTTIRAVVPTDGAGLESVPLALVDS